MIMVDATHPNEHQVHQAQIETVHTTFFLFLAQEDHIKLSIQPG